MLSKVPLCNRQDIERLMRLEEKKSSIPTDAFSIDDWVPLILRLYLAEQIAHAERLGELFEFSRPQILRNIGEARIVVRSERERNDRLRLDHPLVLFSVNEGIRAINRIIETHTRDRSVVPMRRR